MQSLLRPLVGRGVVLAVMNERCHHASHHRVQGVDVWMPRDVELLRTSVPVRNRERYREGETSRTMARRMMRHKSFNGLPTRKASNAAVQLEVRKLSPVTYWGWRHRKPSSRTEQARLLGL